MPPPTGGIVSGFYGGERLAVMEAEYIEQTNGHGTPPPLPANTGPQLFRLVKRTRGVVLDGEYEGLIATIRTNVPVGELLNLLEASAGGDEASTTRAFAEMVNHLPTFILSWNLGDEDGNPVPITPEGIRANVPGDLLMMLVGKMAEGPTVPKS
jgi:hypothetical protein